MSSEVGSALDPIRARLRSAEDLERSEPDEAERVLAQVEEQLGALPSDRRVRELRAWARYRRAFFRRQLPSAPLTCAELANICEAMGDLEATVRWLREARVADEQLEEVRRRRRREGEKLRRGSGSA